MLIHRHNVSVINSLSKDHDNTLISIMQACSWCHQDHDQETFEEIVAIY